MAKKWLFIWSVFYLGVALHLLCILTHSHNHEGHETVLSEGIATSLSRILHLRQPPRQSTTREMELPQSSGFIDFRLHVSKKTIKITVDGVEVVAKNMTFDYLNNTRPTTYAGLYLLVLQEFSGRPMKVERYLMLQLGGEIDLLKMLVELQPGRIIVLASLFESFVLISKIFLKYLTLEGSTAIADIKRGDRWAMVWTKGGRVWWEAKTQRQMMPSTFWQGGNINVALEIPKSIEKTCKLWPSTNHWNQRRQFCRNYEGHGNLCSCQKPLKIDLTSKNKFLSLEDTFLLIIASQKPFTLSRSLNRLSQITGFTPSKTVVSADGSSREVEQLATLFGLKYLNHRSNISDVTRRITSHYFFALNQSFGLFPKAREAIILEEDLFVSKDFFGFFSQLAPILESDPSLYCVSAWNDFGFTKTASNSRDVHRTDTMPGLGWMITRTLFEELKPKWPWTNEITDWDMWMRFNDNMKGRQCLIPEISRTFHFGREGVHTSSQTQRLYYDDRKLPQEKVIILDGLDRLDKRSYEEDLIKGINSSIHINLAVHNPCEDNFLPRNQNQSYVLWFKMINLDDTFTWSALLQCLGMWSPDIRGGYKKVWKLRFLGTPLYVIGWPMSPYSYLKPKEATIMRRSTGERDETEPPIIIETVL